MYIHLSTKIYTYVHQVVPLKKNLEENTSNEMKKITDNGKNYLKRIRK